MDKILNDSAEGTKDRTADIVEQLRSDLLTYIRVQEKAFVLYNKVLRRLAWILVPLSFLVLGGLASMIYLVTRPNSETIAAMEKITEVSKSLVAQREFIQDDRRDIAKARLELKDLISKQDSLNTLLRIKLAK